MVANFEQTCSRTDAALEKLAREYGEIVPHMDPVLKGSWRAYKEFCVGCTPQAWCGGRSSARNEPPRSLQRRRMSCCV